MSFQRRVESLRKSMEDGAERGYSEAKMLPPLDRLLDEVSSPADLIALAQDESRNSGTRGLAEWTLGRLGAKTARQALLKLLEHPDRVISFNAADALCRIGTKTMIRRVIRTLKASPYPESRAGAAWIMHKVTHRDAAPALRLAALHDPTPTVRVAAMHGLISYPSQETYAALAMGLADRSVRVRTMSIFAVSCLSDRSGIDVALPALERLAGDKTIVRHRGLVAQDARDAIAAILSNVTGKTSIVQRKTLGPKGAGKSKDKT